MILTGTEIEREMQMGRIVIDPYDPGQIEPNSYGFRLASRVLWYTDSIIDPHDQPHEESATIPDAGLCLYPGRLYLGSTVETMGSEFYAATLYARRSTSTLGIWIQYSAPLGHTGAIIPWTLELRVAHPVIVYPGMLIGKIAFWRTQGRRHPYQGKYNGSLDVVASRLSQEATE